MPKIGDSVISSYFKAVEKPTGESTKRLGSKVYIGQVEKVHFVDDVTNVSKQFVEYDVSVRDENGGQTVYKNVIAEGHRGGSNDFSETILEPNEFPFQGKLDTSNIFSNKNGTLVYVAFRDNSLDKPYIEGCIDHPRAPSARRADGIRHLSEFRGVEFNINKDGEVILTYNGGKNSDGSNPRPDTAPTTLKIDSEGDLSITNKAGQTFKISRSEDTMTMTFANGLSITYNGSSDQVSIQTAGGASVTVDGSGDDINLEAAGSAKLNLNSATVALGASGIEILDKLSIVADLVSQWATNVGAAHTHIGNLGYSTAPPDQAGDYTTLGSDLASEKADVDSIKGSL